MIVSLSLFSSLAKRGVGDRSDQQADDLMIKLAYTLKEHGWAEIDAQLAQTAIRFPLSYISQALDDLVAAVTAILLGQPVARFALIDEPGAFCWILVRRQDRLAVTILHLQTMYCFWRYEGTDEIPPDEEAEFITSIECGVKEFVSATRQMLLEIDLRYSAADFERTHNPVLSSKLAARLSILSGGQAA